MSNEKKKAIKEIVSNAIEAIVKTLNGVDPESMEEVKNAALTCASIQRCALLQAKAIAKQTNLKNFKSGGMISSHNSSVVFDHSEIVFPMTLEQRRDQFTKVSPL